MNKRLTDVTAMDIYDVKKAKGVSSLTTTVSRCVNSSSAPGRSQYQLRLTDDEPVTGVARGTVAWLSGGLRTQESQYVLPML
jgi:hypothetical protein